MRSCGAMVAIGVALSAAASGCSGGGNHAATLPPVTSTSSIPTTTTAPTQTGDPTPSTTLTLFNEHDASVDAFVQSFFAAYNAAQDSRDLSAFEALYLPQCTGCTAMRDELAGWLANGQTIEGGDWHILQQTSNSLVNGSKGTMGSLAYRDSAQLVDPSGETTEVIPATAVIWYQGSLVGPAPWRFEDLGTVTT